MTSKGWRAGPVISYALLVHEKHRHAAVNSHLVESNPVISTVETEKIYGSTGISEPYQMRFRDNESVPVLRALAAMTAIAAMMMAKRISLEIIAIIYPLSILQIAVPHMLIIMLCISFAFAADHWSAWIAACSCQLLIAGSSEVYDSICQFTKLTPAMTAVAGIAAMFFEKREGTTGQKAFGYIAATSMTISMLIRYITGESSEGGDWLIGFFILFLFIKNTMPKHHVWARLAQSCVIVSQPIVDTLSTGAEPWIVVLWIIAAASVTLDNAMQLHFYDS